MYSNARLQAFSSRSGVYLSQTHARLVALLLYFVAAENGLDSDLRVAADFTGPVNEPFTIPLDILLVLWRHMLLDRTVLVKPSVQPGMGTDSVSTVENLYRGSGESDIYLLLDVFKGNRIVHTLHRNVVIGTHRCHFPGGQFKRPGRQRAQEGLSSAKLLARLPSLFWKGLWLNVSRRSQIALFSSNRDKNWRFRRAASMKVEMIPTVPSTAALSLGARTLAGRIAVP